MNSLSQRRSTLLVVAVVGMMLVLSIVPAAAQTATPVPPTATAAPAVLELPVDVIFSETNNWLGTFAPVAAIGIGITIALAVLGYLGRLIVGAFKN
jgi:hypothetical protein